MATDCEGGRGEGGLIREQFVEAIRDVLCTHALRNIHDANR